MFVHPDWPQSIDNAVVNDNKDNNDNNNNNNNNNNNKSTGGFLSAHKHQLNTNSIPEII